MKPTTFCSCFFIILIVFTGCQKDIELKPDPAQGYPTTYNPLSQSEWDALNLEFQKINSYKGLTLNEYGFVKGKILLNEKDSLTKDFVISMLDNLINRYKRFFGIPENALFNFEKDIFLNVRYWIPNGTITIERFYEDLELFPEIQSNEEIRYNFFLRQSRFDGELFQGPELYFDFKKEEGFIEISGNWFPETIIPDSPIFTESNAISAAYWKILENTGIDLWESKHLFNVYQTFLRNYADNSIEIRHCWCVTTQADEQLMCYVYIDTQTGEIIKYYSRNWLYYVIK